MPVFGSESAFRSCFPGFYRLDRNSALNRLERVCLGLIVGGGFSNVLDRVLHGSVIDFIDVRGIPHWHYIFNTADVLIHLGIWPLVLYYLLAPNAQKKSPSDPTG